MADASADARHNSLRRDGEYSSALVAPRAPVRCVGTAACIAHDVVYAASHGGMKACICTNISIRTISIYRCMYVLGPAWTSRAISCRARHRQARACALACVQVRVRVCCRACCCLSVSLSFLSALYMWLCESAPKRECSACIVVSATWRLQQTQCIMQHGIRSHTTVTDNRTPASRKYSTICVPGRKCRGGAHDGEAEEYALQLHDLTSVFLDSFFLSLNSF